MKLLLKLTKTSLLALLLMFANHSIASSENLEKQIIQEFQGEFNKIEAFAKSNPKPIKTDILMEFIDKELMSRWSAELTIRSILGKELWKSVEADKKQQLINAYYITMKRYLFESFQQYNGQKPLASKIQLNKKQNKGWLTAQLMIDNFPDIHLDLKIYFFKEQWVIYDFRFKGISFIKLKQNEYRNLVEEQGAQPLISLLEGKYQEFLKQLDVEQ